MKKTEIKMLPGECWYGFVVEDCLSYPLDEKSTYTCLQRSDNHSTKHLCYFPLQVDIFMPIPLWIFLSRTV